MSKLTLTDLTNLENATAITTVNNNSDAIETAFDNTLSRDGSSPNTMGASLDMNSHSVLNLPAATTSTEPVRKAEFDTTIAALSATGLSLTGSGLVAYNNSGGTVSEVTITAGTGGITVSNGDGTTGNPTISFDSSTLTYPSGLNPIKAVTAAADTIPYYTGVSTGSTATFNALGRSIVGAASTSAVRTAIGTVIGTDVLAYDAGLAATTTFIKTLLDDTDAKTARATLGVRPEPQIKVIADTTTLTTGTGQAYYIITSSLNGLKLVDAQAYVTTNSSSGLPTIQIKNVTQSNTNLLTTAITIDANEASSYTAATPSVCGTSITLATGDLLSIDVSVAGTGAKGLGVVLVFG